MVSSQQRCSRAQCSMLIWSVLAASVAGEQVGCHYRDWGINFEMWIYFCGFLFNPRCCPWENEVLLPVQWSQYLNRWFWKGRLWSSRKKNHVIYQKRVQTADIKLKPLLIMPFYMYRDPAAAVDLPQMGHDNFQVTKCPFQTRFYDICSDSVIYTLQNNAQQPQKLAQKGRET